MSKCMCAECNPYEPQDNMTNKARDELLAIKTSNMYIMEKIKSACALIDSQSTRIAELEALLAEANSWFSHAYSPEVEDIRARIKIALQQENTK